MTTNPLLSFFKESVEGDTDFGVSFKEMIYNRLGDLAEEALNERKKHVAAIYFSEKIDDQEEDLQVLKQGDVSDEDKKKKLVKKTS
jgi:hypothetical protein